MFGVTLPRPSRPAPDPDVGHVRRGAFRCGRTFPLRGHFTRAEQTRQALAANPEAHYSIEELSIAEAYDELPEDMKRRLVEGRAGYVQVSQPHDRNGARDPGLDRGGPSRPARRWASRHRASPTTSSAPSRCSSTSARSTPPPTACSAWWSSSRARRCCAASRTSAICTPASRSSASTGTTIRSSRSPTGPTTSRPWRTTSAWRWRPRS